MTELGTLIVWVMFLPALTQISLPRVDGQESVTYLERLGLRRVLQQELTLVLVGLGRPVVLCGPAAFKAFAPGTCSKASAVQ